MKKSTKSEKPAAPQVKSVVPKPVEPKPVKKTAAAPRKKAEPKAKAPAAPAPVPAAPVVAPAAKAAAAPAAKAAAAPAAKPVRKPTVIAARINIGFGNTLFVRGEGPGLSWDRGLAMDCLADDLWSVSLPGSGNGVVFKFLVNDLSWSAGSDFVVASGDSVELTPSF